MCETKLDAYDEIKLSGHEFLSQCRKQKCFRKSGGIGVFVKDTISEHVSVVDSESDYVLWLKLDKRAFKMNDDIFIGAIYIPPRDSRFYTNDEIDLFNAEVSEMCISHNYVLLMGDFNARTYDKFDFIEADDYFLDLFDFDVNSDYFNVSSKLDGFKLSENRVSQSP